MSYVQDLKLDAELALRRAIEIQDKAKDAGRDLTDAERADVRKYQKRAAELKAEIEADGKPGKRLTDTDPRPNRSEEERNRDRFRGNGDGPIQWRDAKTGGTVRVYERGVSMRDHFWANPTRKYERDTPEDWNLGRCLRAWYTGKKDDLSDAELRAMSTSSNVAGGYMVPDPLSAEWIDRVRNVSVAYRLGAKNVEMTSGTLMLARVANDPTIAAKGEGDSWTATAPTLDAITLTATTLGAVVDVSEELAQDAPNAQELITQCMVEATAHEIDRQVLAGSANQEMTSPFSLSEALSTGSVGSITWDDILDAIKLLEDVNCTPNGYATTPTISNTLRKLKAGDGANSSALYYSAAAGLPAEVAALTRLTTNQAESGCLYLADWTRILIGVRMDITLEVTREAGERWNKFQRGFRVAWRGALNATHANHLHKLSGAS